MRHQLLWGRTVNVHGKPGKNIACDLHLEHLNRDCKNAIGALGPNIGDESVARAGKCIGELRKVVQQFDCTNGVRVESGSHSKRTVAADLDRILKTARSCAKMKCSATNQGEHRHFPKFQANITRGIDKTKFKQWMVEHVKQLY